MVVVRMTTTVTFVDLAVGGLVEPAVVPASCLSSRCRVVWLRSLSVVVVVVAVVVVVVVAVVVLVVMEVVVVVVVVVVVAAVVHKERTSTTTA